MEQRVVVKLRVFFVLVDDSHVSLPIALRKLEGTLAGSAVVWQAGTGQGTGTLAYLPAPRGPLDQYSM